MRYLVPGSQDIWITDKYDLVDSKGNLLELPLDGDKIRISLFGLERLRSLEWIYCWSRLRAVVKSDIDNIDFIKVNASRNQFPWTTVFKQPKYYDKERTLRIVPGYPAIAINDNGSIVLDTLHNLPYKLYQDNPEWYRYILSAYDFIRNTSFPLAIYRLVALAWVYNPDPANLNVVNHLNGNKTDCRKENLEWTTNKGNILHAVKYGLNTQAKRCKLHNIKTDEILEFPSLEQANAFLGMRPKEIVNFKQRRANLVYNGKYEVRMEDDNRPWSYTKQTVNVEPSRYIYRITDNGVTRIFNGTRSVIKFYKLWNLPTNSSKGVINALAQQNPKLKIEVVDQYDTRPLQIKNIETGDVVEFSKVKDAVNAIGFCETMLLYGIKYNGKKVIKAKYVVRRKTDEPWPTKLIKVKNKPVGIKITNKATNKVQTFRSLKEAARNMSISRHSITRHADYPKQDDKYKMEYVPLGRVTDQVKKVNC